MQKLSLCITKHQFGNPVYFYNLTIGSGNQHPLPGEFEKRIGLYVRVNIQPFWFFSAIQMYRFRAVYNTYHYGGKGLEMTDSKNMI